MSVSISAGYGEEDLFCQQTSIYFCNQTVNFKIINTWSPNKMADKSQPSLTFHSFIFAQT